MKNLLLFGLVALCAALLSSESVMAGGNSGGGGKGGGKAHAKSSIKFTNVDLANDVQIYVRGPGEPFPTNIDTLRGKLLLANKAGGTATTGKLSRGGYLVYVASAAQLAQIPNGQAITEAGYFNLGGSQPKKIELSGVDLAADVNSAGDVVVK